MYTIPHQFTLFFLAALPYSSPTHIFYNTIIFLLNYHLILPNFLQSFIILLIPYLLKIQSKLTIYNPLSIIYQSSIYQQKFQPNPNYVPSYEPHKSYYVNHNPNIIQATLTTISQNPFGKNFRNSSESFSKIIHLKIA